MRVGIPQETASGERRVAATPDSVKRLIKLGYSVAIEAGAGRAAGFADAAYAEAGAELVDAGTAWGSDVVAKLRAPTEQELPLLRAGATLISSIYPAHNRALLDALVDRGVSVVAMDQVPRTTRAQKVDSLSSMANLAGYRAVIEAAQALPRPLGGQSTAAGKIPPAKVLVIGAGVAGLAAIGAARALGAIVRAFDTRPIVREQVSSMGAEFLEVQLAEDGSGQGGYAREMSPAFIEAEMALFAAQAKEVDIIITTALIPGKRAPILITRAMVESMRTGSVVVDLAAEQGGNCELTTPGQAAVHGGDTIVGYTDLVSRLATQASQLYAINIVHLLDEAGGAEKFALPDDNDILRPMTILKQGVLQWPPPKQAEPTPAPSAAAAKKQVYGSHHGPPIQPHAGKKSNAAWWMVAVAGAALLGIGLGAPPVFLTHFTVFVLACFIGYQVIWSVTPALHTPLMSVTNAISGIIVLGGMLQISGPKGSPATVLGAIAIFVAMINIAGGFLVTQRMLKMFHR
jgi:NAD(P) transhydrogenase subunit alpha